MGREVRPPGPPSHVSSCAGPRRSAMAIELRQPSGIDEWRRVVHALQAGTSITGQEAYLVASTVPPLYRVQGVVGSEAEARRLAASDVEAALGWSKQERNQRVIWGPIQ